MQEGLPLLFGSIRSFPNKVDGGFQKIPVKWNDQLLPFFYTLHFALCSILSLLCLTLLASSPFTGFHFHIGSTLRYYFVGFQPLHSYLSSLISLYLACCHVRSVNIFPLGQILWYVSYVTSPSFLSSFLSLELAAS